MSIIDKMEKIRIEVRSITADMRGINPKTELYKRLAKRRQELADEISRIGTDRRSKS